MYLSIITPALFSLLLLSTGAFGTCIVIHLTAKGIMAGADSRRVMYIGEVGASAIKEEIRDDYCKIRVAGRFNYAVAGFDDDLLHSIAHQACMNKSKSINAIDEFERLVQSKYAAKVEEFRNYDIRKYVERFPNKETPAGQVAFFYYESGKPHVYLAELKLLNTPSQSVAISIARSMDLPVTVIGVTDAIYSIPYNEVTKGLEINRINYIRQLINRQSTATPQWVGGPTDLLSVGPQGRKWITKKKGCQ